MTWKCAVQLHCSSPPSPFLPYHPLSFHFLPLLKVILGHNTSKYRTEQSPLILERQKAQLLNWNKIIQTFAPLQVYKFHFVDLYFHKRLSCQSYFIFTEVKKIWREEVLEQSSLQHIWFLSSWCCKESLEVSKMQFSGHVTPCLQGPCPWARHLDTLDRWQPWPYDPVSVS